MTLTLAVIHTTVLTVEPLKALAGELLPGCRVVNFVDDSILPHLAKTGGDVAGVEKRLVAYAGFAQEAGADVILNACSSVGEVVAAMQQAVSIPVVRIDQPMAARAVRQGRRLGVAATLSTTLNPTLGLLEQEARTAGRDVELRPVLVDSAYERLLAGDREGHDRVLGASLETLARGVDLVVLAQASMARVVAQLPDPLQEKFLSSPRLGFERVREVMKTLSSRNEESYFENR